MRISKSFTIEEFACHDGTPVPDYLLDHLQHLVDSVLQPVRDRWATWSPKTPQILVVSGFRTTEWNKRVGGAKKSTHLVLKGADIKPVYLRDVPRLFLMVLDMYQQGLLPALGGLGEYPGWVHVDTSKATDGHLRRWKGGGVGSEPES